MGLRCRKYLGMMRLTVSYVPGTPKRHRTSPGPVRSRSQKSANTQHPGISYPYFTEPCLSKIGRPDAASLRLQAASYRAAHESSRAVCALFGSYERGDQRTQEKVIIPIS